jgi:hypothetical protein
LLKAIGDANDSFRDAYGTARDRAGSAGAKLIVLGNAIVLHHDGARREIVLESHLFDLLKSTSHLPIAIFAMLHEGVPSIDSRCRAALERLKGRMREGMTELAAFEGPVDVIANARLLLDSSMQFVERALAESEVTAAALLDFARGSAPALLKATADATENRLRALDREVKALLEELDGDQRDGLEVVVSGDHQARERSLPMQYFERLFGEKPGEEKRVTYGERIDDEAAALALIGTRRLDRAIASAFFGDPQRLQRDVLGDAAKERIGSMYRSRPDEDDPR